MLLAPRGDKPCGGIPFPIVFLRAIAVHKRLGHERHDGPLVRMEKRGAQHLMRRGDGPMAVAPAVNTRHRASSWTKNTPCHQGPRENGPPETPSVPAPCRAGVAERDLCTPGASTLGETGASIARRRGVARDALNPVDGVQMAFAPLLVKGEERGRFAGKHRACGHQRLRESNVGLAEAVIRDVSKTVSHQATEGISREMRACVGSNNGHEKPHHEHRKACKSGGIFASMFTKGQCS